MLIGSGHFSSNKEMKPFLKKILKRLVKTLHLVRPESVAVKTWETF